MTWEIITNSHPAKQKCMRNKTRQLYHHNGSMSNAYNNSLYHRLGPYNYQSGAGDLAAALQYLVYKPCCMFLHSQHLQSCLNFAKDTKVLHTKNKYAYNEIMLVNSIFVCFLHLPFVQPTHTKCNHSTSMLKIHHLNSECPFFLSPRSTHFIHATGVPKLYSIRITPSLPSVSFIQKLP